jgi:hypothetical protein
MYRAGKESASLNVDSLFGEEFEPDDARCKGFMVPASVFIALEAIKINISISAGLACCDWSSG